MTFFAAAAVAVGAAKMCRCSIFHFPAAWGCGYAFINIIKMISSNLDLLFQTTIKPAILPRNIAGVWLFEMNKNLTSSTRS